MITRSEAGLSVRFCSNDCRGPWYAHRHLLRQMSLQGRQGHAPVVGYLRMAPALFFQNGQQGIEHLPIRLLPAGHVVPRSPARLLHCPLVVDISPWSSSFLYFWANNATASSSSAVMGLLVRWLISLSTSNVESQTYVGFLALSMDTLHAEG